MRVMISYCAIRLATFPFQWLPFSWIHRMGGALGYILYYGSARYRKRVLSNLALAQDLKLNNQEIVKIAKQTFQNLVITALEYSKIAKSNLSEVTCLNPETADKLHEQGQGIIFFCAHQANWELLFLEGTKRMKGVAIGKGIDNERLYNWIIKIRERFGGKIISNHDALREGAAALKSGQFLGIVGEQGMPTSSYSTPFLGRVAKFSPAPALLAYRTSSPIVFASIHRRLGKYSIHYSDPIWPDQTQPLKQEVQRLMGQTLSLVQESIKKTPSQWLWQHNCWKQQTPKTLIRRFRHDCICIIIDRELEGISTFREIYPTEFLVVICPETITPNIQADEIIHYRNIAETLRDDYRFKLVFNFTAYKQIKRHYLQRSANEVVDTKTLKKLSHASHLSEILKQALCRSKNAS